MVEQDERGNAPAHGLRVDKWLWAARFYKTRSLAAEAVSGGKVHVNERRVKPARTVRPGDRLEIRRGPDVMTIVVEGVSERRGPAAYAQQLYSETEESYTAREEARERRRATREAVPMPSPNHRPHRRDRRRLRRFTGKE